MIRRSCPMSVHALLACTALATLPIFNRDDPTIQAHRDRQAAITDASQQILAAADAESRDLMEAEQRELASLTNEYDNLEGQIGLRERVTNQVSNLNAPRPRQSEPEAITNVVARPDAAAAAPYRAEPRPLPTWTPNCSLGYGTATTTA